MTSESDTALQAMALERASLLERLPQSASGLAWCHAHSDLFDRVVRRLYDEAVSSHPEAPPVALIATGGYGRRELAPYSDLDLTLVPQDDAAEGLDDLVRTLFQTLHQVLGTVFRADVGYSYRLIADLPGVDPRTRTALLDARLVAGAPDVHRRLTEAFWDSFSPGDFLLEKVSERSDAHRATHDTPLVVEPHLKEGSGGLRSFQCANWIRLAIGERAIRPTPEYDGVLHTRNLLHFVSGRKNDLLTRARQAEIADLTGAEVYAMSSRLAGQMAGLAREYETSLDRLREARFPLAPGVAAIRGEARVLPGADAGQAAVGIAIATRLGLGVADVPVATGAEIDGPAALYAFSSGESTLRNLDRCGLLERLLPELTRCRTLMPRDSVHRYTVFEHTLRVLRHLDALEPHGFLGGIKESLSDESLLYLAALLHDVGKWDESRPHSETGADMVHEVAGRWGLSAGDREHVAWLVREHLTMARFIRIRDLQNPDTITEFAGIVQDMERLSALTLLTWADINAVSPEVWTPAQEAFLRELYSRTADFLQGDASQAADPSLYRQRVARELRGDAVSEQEVARFVDSLPAHYLASVPSEVVPLHLRFVRKAEQGEPTIEYFHQAEPGSTELTVCAPDAAGLLSRILGVLYAYDVSVSGIRAATTRTERPVALDVFSVNLNGRPLPPSTGRHLGAQLMAVLKGEASMEALLRDRGKDPEMRQRVFSYDYIEGNPGVLEVRAARGRGVAYRLSRQIADLGWNIVSARLGQWAGQSAAAFYLLDGQDRPLTKEAVERALAATDRS